MEMQEAKRLLEVARQQVEAAQEALEAARDALTQTKLDIASALGPFKIGEHVQRAGDKRIYKITHAEILVHGEEVYPMFHAYPIKADGELSTRNEQYISVVSKDKWQLVSLPQE